MVKDMLLMFYCKYIWFYKIIFFESRNENRNVLKLLFCLRTDRRLTDINRASQVPFNEAATEK